MLEELRYESWECTDVVGVSRTEYVTVKIATNGTAFTKTGCFTTKLSEDLSYVQKFEHACGEEPTELTPDGSWYTNFRLNSTAVPAPATMTCVGAPVTLDTSGIAPYYEGAGSVASESSYVGDVYPPFESVNSNGLPDYSEAKGKPFIDGLTYNNNEEDDISVHYQDQWSRHPRDGEKRRQCDRRGVGVLTIDGIRASPSGTALPHEFFLDPRHVERHARRIHDLLRSR